MGHRHPLWTGADGDRSRWWPAPSEVSFRGEHFCSDSNPKQTVDLGLPSRDASMSYQGWLPQCAICRESVTLEESNTDERGQAIHKNWYTWTIVQADAVPTGLLTGLYAQVH